MKYFKAIIFFAYLSVLFGCGGGSPPREIRDGAIETNKLRIDSQDFLVRRSLGLVHGLFLLEDNKSYGVIGYEEACKVTAFGDVSKCASSPESLDIKLPVSKDGYLPPLGSGAIFADFNADGSLDRLEVSGNGFKIISNQGNVLGQVKVRGDYWYEPAISWSPPHNVFVSTDGMLLVFDPTLRKIITFAMSDIKAPLHISDGIILEYKERRFFVSVFKGRGGWHRTVLLIHNEARELLYKEILVGDFPSLAPGAAEDDTVSFLLGGRGSVQKYSFSLP